ncbi:MAG: hypothetical protein H9535_19595 [Ignavibacteria bacterium]|nr:hypothetical protein [Ignavibacteria bacterium]
MQNQSNKRNHAVASAIVQCILDNDCTLRHNYSGRGMYDRNCIGYMTDSPLKSLVSITSQIMESELSDSEKEHAVRILENASMDNMGYSSIIYFSGLQWSEELAEEYHRYIDED